jgi:integrase
MRAYIALCLATGIRTEEARALRWGHASFGNPDATPPVPASAAVRRSVRAHGDTKTEKSRRTLALPQMATEENQVQFHPQFDHIIPAQRAGQDHAAATGSPDWQPLWQGTWRRLSAADPLQ